MKAEFGTAIAIGSLSNATMNGMALGVSANAASNSVAWGLSQTPQV